MGTKFIDYNSSVIVNQFTLLKKFEELVKYLKVMKEIPDFPTFDKTKSYQLLLIPNESETAYELKFVEIE